MNITQDSADGKTIVSLDGRFNFGVRNVFKAAIAEAVEKGHPIILDLGKVSFVDSSALGLLVISHQNLKNKKIPFYLMNPQTYVKQVLDLANIGKMIPIYQTVAEVPQGPQLSVAAPA